MLVRASRGGLVFDVHPAASDVAVSSRMGLRDGRVIFGGTSLPAAKTSLHAIPFSETGDDDDVALITSVFLYVGVPREDVKLYIDTVRIASCGGRIFLASRYIKLASPPLPTPDEARGGGQPAPASRSRCGSPEQNCTTRAPSCSRFPLSSDDCHLHVTETAAFAMEQDVVTCSYEWRGDPLLLRDCGSVSRSPTQPAGLHEPRRRSASPPPVRPRGVSRASAPDWAE